MKTKKRYFALAADFKTDQSWRWVLTDENATVYENGKEFTVFPKSKIPLLLKNFAKNEFIKEVSEEEFALLF